MAHHGWWGEHGHASVRGKLEGLVRVAGLVGVGLEEVWLNRVGFTNKRRGELVRVSITVVRLAGIEGLVDVGLVLVLVV